MRIACRSSAPNAESERPCPVLRHWPPRATPYVVSLGLMVCVPLVSSGQVPTKGPVTAARATDSLTLTVQDVRRLTLAQSPSLLAARQDTVIARGGVRQARQLRFNPDLSAVIPGPGIGGNRNAAEFMLMQELELAGQRGLRVGAAQRGVERAAGTVANTTRLGLADASFAFYRALAAQRRLQVTQDVLQLTERLLGAVRTQLSEGEISALEGTLAEIEFGRAQARVLSAQRDANASMLELARLVGLSPTLALRLVDQSAGPNDTTSIRTPVALAMTTASIDSLTQLALSRRPDLTANAAALRESEALVRLSQREALPNLRIGVLSERTPGQSGVRFGPAVGFSLPFFNRSQGLLDQRRAEVRQILFLRDAARLQVRTDVETAVRAVILANAEVSVFETSVRRPARQNSALLETAFRAGKIALPTLLLLRNQLLDAELGYWQAWQARQEALTLLESASGTLTGATVKNGAPPSGTPR